MALVTLEQAKRHLRLEDDDEDIDLDEKIDQASEIVLDYLKRSESSWEDPEFVPRPIQAATLLVLLALYDDREGTGKGDYLNPGGAVERLLIRYRDPAYA